MNIKKNYSNGFNYKIQILRYEGYENYFSSWNEKLIMKKNWLLIRNLLIKWNLKYLIDFLEHKI
jgi:hypothetical protein